MSRLFAWVTSITAAVFVSILSTAVSAQPVFGQCCARYDFPVTGAPRAIAAADVSGDGYMDLVLAGTAPGNITVLTNFGLEDGDNGERFRAKDYAVGGGPFEIALGDLNRDGWIDIALANADSNAITLLFNDRHGDFGAPVNLPFPDNPRGIAIGDFNRDGIPDIVATKFTATTVDVLYGAGDGTFPRRLSLQAPAGAQGVAVGDFDNDGWTDFAVAATSGTVRVYKMFATGAVVVDLNPSGVGWNVLAVADLDRDGRQDIAVASTGSSVVQVLYNRASGWAASPQIPVAASPRGIAVADLDRNGTGEIVVAGRAASMITIITRAANGTFSTSDVPAGTGARTVALADMNNSGGPDIVTANEFARSTTIWYNGTPLTPAGFSFERQTLPPLYEGGVFGVADFNHNGKLDVVRASHVFFDGTTQSRYLGKGTAELLSSGGGVGDFNRDGNPDVVYTVFDAFKVFFGDGAGGFVAGPETAAPAASQIRVADLNRDGRPDLVVLSGGSTVPNLTIYLGLDGGSFASGTRLDGNWNDYETGDFDGDGIVDIVASSPGGITVFLGDGRGGIKATKVFEPGVERFGIGVGDLNRDGRLDIVAVDATDEWGFRMQSSRFTVTRGNGDGTFEAVGHYETAERPGQFRFLYDVMIGDVNGDGNPDVFTSHGDLFTGTGLGAPLGEIQRFATEGVRSMTLADVNGDGLLDILGYNIYALNAEPAQVIMLNTQRTPNQNRPPTGLAMPDRIVWPYEQTYADTDENEIDVTGVSDPDLHAVRYRWTLADGTVVSSDPWWTPRLRPGTYQVTVTVDDFRGASIADTFTLDVPPFQEMVLTVASGGVVYGAWRAVDDPTAAEGRRLWHPDSGAPKQVTPLANPANFFEVQFLADPTQEYKLWVRMKAENDYWGNDSVFVQFTGAKDAAGNPIYQIGTTSALTVNLEECSGCGISGWGWEDDGWGAVNANGTTLRFPGGGPQTLRVQTREDGVSIDEIVLSAVKYKTTRPGAAKNDATILQRHSPDLVPPQR